MASETAAAAEREEAENRKTKKCGGVSSRKISYHGLREEMRRSKK
jgi:hypothetical protein